MISELPSDEPASLVAYLRLIERQGASAQVVAERRRLLTPLVRVLEGKPQQLEVFREAVEMLLADCEPDERVITLTSAREYYYFWLGDVKKLAAMTSRAGFSTRNVHIEVTGSLDDLCQRLQQQGFADFPPSLGIYLGELFENGVDESVIAEREILLKAMLFLLHGQPYKPESYRVAVDAMLLHLAERGNHTAFLDLAREFFYYWLSFPPATERHAADAG
ncbi:hypothetical protein GKE73_12140 [Paludibacterium sp. dN 18-1]|uniref:Uncharacterized protein n=1 Tax=Paludibacterium denitrificans TaxID=2675226 RepID=A0A844GDY7_9NEIS|nr:hypothetical protein [Paludibacterium denitrificans]